MLFKLNTTYDQKVMTGLMLYYTQSFFQNFSQGPLERNPGYVTLMQGTLEIQFLQYTYACMYISGRNCTIQNMHVVHETSTYFLPHSNTYFLNTLCGIVYLKLDSKTPSVTTKNLTILW